MKKTLKTSLALILLSCGIATAQSILFVGNSFTFVPKEYGSGTVNDLHGSGIGGIPAIFKQLAQEGGKDPQVSSELSGGKTLEWHVQNHTDKIKQPWDIVILQEYSTRPLTSDAGNKNGSNREAFRKGVQDLEAIVTSENPDVQIYLYETWARPDRVLAGFFEDLTAMQKELREGYSQAAIDFELTGWVPVGDSFVQAVHRGISDDPSTKDVKEGPIDLWGGDKYHQSKYGAYLSALIFYSTIYKADPRELPTGEGSAAAGLNLDPKNADMLQELAYDMVNPQLDE